MGTDGLAKDDASAILKQSGLVRLGLVLDADSDSKATWQSIRGLFQDAFHDMPLSIPPKGFISMPNAKAIRFGAWIMPDNQTTGMLESFLKLLVRNEHSQLFEFAAKVCEDAKNQFNAPFKDVHRDKANMHTFLAWQDEPGRQLHEAIDHAVLDPASPHSKPFVDWFRDLFEV